METSKFHGFAYDGIWVIAKTLTRVMKILRDKERQDIYHNFTVDDREVGKMVLDVMNETNFFGVTVSFCFMGFVYCLAKFLLNLHGFMCKDLVFTKDNNNNYEDDNLFEYRKIVESITIMYSQYRENMMAFG